MKLKPFEDAVGAALFSLARINAWDRAAKMVQVAAVALDTSLQRLDSGHSAEHRYYAEELVTLQSRLEVRQRIIDHWVNQWI
jgi:hypothetical protein